MTERTTIYHHEHGASELYPIDAREAVQRFPDEWSFQPWSKGQASAQRQAQTDAQTARVAARKSDEEDTANGRITKRLTISSIN